jgi:O-antigen/teichoic acid export membrane protein
MSLIRNTISSVRQKIQNKEHRAPVYFTVSSLGMTVAGLLSTIATTHYINPRDLGLWASVSLAAVYASFLMAGLSNGLSRELPYYLGANDTNMAQRLAATTLFYTLLCCVLTTLGTVAAIVYLISKHASSQVIYSVIAVAILIIIKFYTNYLFTTFRSKNSFVALSWVQVWQTIVTVVALPLLVLGYGGMLVRTVLISALGLYWMHRARPMMVTPSWNTKSFKLLFKTGIMIFAPDYVAGAAGTFDKVALLKYGGVEQLGYYALALSAYSAFQSVPTSIAHYVYPRMSHHYGRTNNPRVIWGIAWKTNLIVLACMLPIAVVGSLLMPPSVRLLFPKYVAGTRAAEIALFAGAAYGATVGTNALSSMKAWSHLVSYQLLYSLLLVVGPFLGVRFASTPLTGVAYGVLGANVGGAILGLLITFSATHSNAVVPQDPTEPDVVAQPSIGEPEQVV